MKLPKTCTGLLVFYAKSTLEGCVRVVQFICKFFMVFSRYVILFYYNWLILSSFLPPPSMQVIFEPSCLVELFCYIPGIVKGERPLTRYCVWYKNMGSDGECLLKKPVVGWVFILSFRQYPATSTAYLNMKILLISQALTRNTTVSRTGSKQCKLIPSSIAKKYCHLYYKLRNTTTLDLISCTDYLLDIFDLHTLKPCPMCCC